MKNSFLIYNDSLAVLDSLSDEQAGQLFRAMRTYHETGELPEDQLLKLALVPFINQWKRDLVKFDKVCERNRSNGLKGGRPKNPVGILGTQKNPSKPKKAESDSDSDNDSDKESDTTKAKRKAPAPTLEEVQLFFKENGYSVEIGTKAFHYYAESGWKDSRGEPVRAWKQKMRGVWFREEHKQQAARSYDPRNGSVPAVYTSPDKYRPV
jgi:hypothetical protein